MSKQQKSKIYEPKRNEVSDVNIFTFLTGLLRLVVSLNLGLKGQRPLIQEWFQC